ncbi:MAG: dihydropyrimidinase, partial [Chloroflexota bacterium]|nr:dihydropyrimidinase [Chloroflexota bacterium]
MPRHTVISGGLVVTESDQVPADLVIEDGQIAALLSDASGVQADDRIEADGLLILPGGIDAHTHFREPDEGSHE